MSMNPWSLYIGALVGGGFFAFWLGLMFIFTDTEVLFLVQEYNTIWVIHFSTWGVSAAFFLLVQLAVFKNLRWGIVTAWGIGIALILGGLGGELSVAQRGDA